MSKPSGILTVNVFFVNDAKFPWNKSVLKGIVVSVFIPNGL